MFYLYIENTKGIMILKESYALSQVEKMTNELVRLRLNNVQHHVEYINL